MVIVAPMMLMERPLAHHPQLSSPGLTGRSSTPRPLGLAIPPLEYWIPAFAGMTISFGERLFP